MLVCASVYQACLVYELFSEAGFKEKAVITSFAPTSDKLRGEGDLQTEQLFKYETYRKMLKDFFEAPDEESAMRRFDEFETLVKKRFVEEPARMKLLIVVDKLLTGFDAPSATYLYIDKKIADHNLFQAICRVNRVNGKEKEYGYIVDYQDLFKSLEQSIKDYTGGAFCQLSGARHRGTDKRPSDGRQKRFGCGLGGGENHLRTRTRAQRRGGLCGVFLRHEWRKQFARKAGVKAAFLSGGGKIHGLLYGIGDGFGAGGI